MKVIYFEWIDAVAGAGWDELKSKHSCDHCSTIGFLVEENDNEITVAATISDKQCNARMTVPKAWIKKRKTIKI